MYRIQLARDTLLIAMTITHSVASQATGVEAALRREVEGSHTPGLQYVHVTGDSELFRHDVGLADVAREEPATRGTTASSMRSIVI